MQLSHAEVLHRAPHSDATGGQSRCVAAFRVDVGVHGVVWKGAGILGVTHAPIIIVGHHLVAEAVSGVLRVVQSCRVLVKVLRVPILRKVA